MPPCSTYYPHPPVGFSDLPPALHTTAISTTFKMWEDFFEKNTRETSNSLIETLMLLHTNDFLKFFRSSLSDFQNICVISRHWDFGPKFLPNSTITFSSTTSYIFLSVAAWNLSWQVSQNLFIDKIMSLILFYVTWELWKVVKKQLKWKDIRI